MTYLLTEEEYAKLKAGCDERFDQFKGQIQVVIQRHRNEINQKEARVLLIPFLDDVFKLTK